MKECEIDYLNWEGKRRKRKVVFTGKMRFGTSEFYKNPTWLLEAIDSETLTVKEFSIENIFGTKVIENEQ